MLFRPVQDLLKGLAILFKILSVHCEELQISKLAREFRRAQVFYQSLTCTPSTTLRQLGCKDKVSNLTTHHAMCC